MLFVNRRTGFRAEIDFRLFRRGDGGGLRRCVEDFYGDGYPYREYLDEEFLLEKIAAGDMTVLCGVADKGEIVSTSALCMSREFKGSALLMLRVVKRAYRDMGIGGAQEGRLFQIAGEHPELKSLYADVMTHNSISQRGLIRRGFVYCGLRMMLYRNPIMVPQLSLPPEGRVSQAVMCRKVCAGPVGVLHCPAEHETEVRRIYGELGAECRIDTGKAAALYGRTRLSWQEEETHHLATAMIHAVGCDFPQMLSCRMKQLGKWEDATVLCYLNLCDRAAVSAYGALKEKGFFFTGVKPLQEEEEYMILAYTSSRKILYEDIHLEESGEKLLSYIRQHQNESQERVLGREDDKK